MLKHVVVNCDFARFSQSDCTAAAVQHLIKECCWAVGFDPNEARFIGGGDGAAIVFPSAIQGEQFAELLHWRTLEINLRARSERQYWCFRVGISGGNVRAEAEGCFSGDAIINAKRLQESCATGAILIDQDAFHALPEFRSALYGEPKIWPGKAHETGILASVRRIVSPAPWTGPGGEWDLEARVAIGAIESIRTQLDNLFQHGTPRAPSIVKPVHTLGESQEVAKTGLDIAELLAKRLIERSQFPTVYDSQDSTPKGQLAGREYVWLTSALDGGRHALRSLPLIATTLALVDTKTLDAVVGATYLPWSQELFVAAEGRGAFRNTWDESNRLTIAERPMDESWIYVEFPNGMKTKQFDKVCALLGQVFRSAKRVRGMSLGSFGLAYVAKGVFNAYLDFSYTSTIHNMAAGCLLVREAGGNVVSMKDATADWSYRCFAGSPKTLSTIESIAKAADLQDSSN